MNGFIARWLKLSLVALVGCGFIAMLVYAFWMKDEIRSATIDPPLIAAPDTPLKRRPEEPGGLEIPHQDKVVFDLLEHPSGTEPMATEVTTDKPVAPIELTEVPIVEEEISEPEPIAPAQPTAEKAPEPPKAEPKPEPVAAVSGNWGVQLGSFSSRADAQKALDKFEGNSALAGMSEKVSQAVVKGRTYYRAQFIGVASRNEATALCKRLGVSCLAVQDK